eukprot:NODE_3743_length_747_cov_313.726879.p5 GENE.NODE_3743_length_747_cov_313.726879~~NODE_3743_length_747_cov_313.726879.p5  ORF type:complete len:50 (+),score=10.72 NODE_3743_length_747_cov_313.726879:153-302(+)
MVASSRVPSCAALPRMSAEQMQELHQRLVAAEATLTTAARERSVLAEAV